MKTDIKPANLVRTIRERLGLSQEKFAAKVGTTFITVNRWENGKAQPSPMAMKLLELLAKDIRAIDLLPHFRK